MRPVLALLLVSGSLGAATEITDPAKFVTDVYARYVRNREYSAPDDIYTPRLKALFDDDKRRAGGEVGCIEFDFWLNAQDYKLRNVQVTAKDVPDHPDRKLVIATFSNLGQAEEIHFDFQKIRGKWLLDDVRSLKRETWTLSKILKCQY